MNIKPLLPYLLAGAIGGAVAVAAGGVTFTASPTQGSQSLANLADTKWGPNLQRDPIVPAVIAFSTVDPVVNADKTITFVPGELVLRESDVGPIRTGDPNDPSEAGYLVLYAKSAPDLAFIIRGPTRDVAAKWAKVCGGKFIDLTYSETR